MKGKQNHNSIPTSCQQNLPIFVVNMKKSIDRKQYIQKISKDIGLKFEFIEAVDGNRLSQHEIDIIYSSELSIKAIGRPLAKPEIGCALSHRKIYQKMIDDKIEQAIVLEDDVILYDDFIQVFDLLEQLPSDWQILLLGANNLNPNQRNFLSRNIKKINDFFIQKPLTCFWGTYAYLINISGATQLLNKTQPLIMPIDHYTGDYHYINVYTLVPFCARSNTSFDSSIESLRVANENEAQVKLSLTKTVLQKIHLFAPIRKIYRSIKYNKFIQYIYFYMKYLVFIR